VTIRDCFNTDRDHVQSADVLLAELDIASYAAGYSAAEYAAVLARMVAVIQARAVVIAAQARFDEMTAQLAGDVANPY
jgi:hypothetical protein